MAMAETITSARFAESIVRRSSKSIPALFALRRGVIALVEGLPLETDDATMKRACLELEDLEDTIMALRPKSVADLLLQVEVARKDIVGWDMVHVERLFSNIKALV